MSSEDNKKQLAESYTRAKRALFDKAYGFLNDNQRRAVFTVNNPLLVLAGAGSGKTTVLVYRIAFIIKYGNAYFENAEKKITAEKVSELEKLYSLEADEIMKILDRFTVCAAPAWSLLSITFTNKAAKEMKQRLNTILGEETASEIMTGTFHSVCVRILRRFGTNIGLKSNFTIYDTDDTKKLIFQIMKDFDIDEKVLPVKMIAAAISSQKEKLVRPEEIQANDRDFKTTRVIKIYREYQNRLAAANAVDFDDIIMKTVELLKSCDDVREYLQKRFKYVCVDEYQDTNESQFELCRLLSGGYRNLMVVGDDDQSIYKFRGATIKNILEFDKIFEDAATIKLEQNYRSTGNILAAANSVIKNNNGRKGKELWTSKDNGDKIVLKKLDDQNAEASYISDTVLTLTKKENRRYSDFAVLYRMNVQSNAIEKVFARSGVPYRVLGGTRFYDRKEIKDVMSYLSVINNSGDNLRLRRIINEPKRKIGNTTIDAIASIAEREGCSYYSVISRAAEYQALSKAASTLSSFARIIDELIGISEKESLSELFRKTIELTGYRSMLEAGGEEDADRIENIDELVSNAVEYENSNENADLRGFLEEVALISDVDNYDKDTDAVVLMTVHSAKGLEFPVVFLPGMESGIFPGVMAITNPDDLEEERRLAYVAITRARERLYITHVRERLLFGRTQNNPVSQFVKEISDELLDASEDVKRKSYVFDGENNIKARKKQAIERGIGAPTVFDKKTNREAETFEAGDTVLHPSFGKGEVISVRTMGSDKLYEIVFDNFGTKKLMGSYAKLKKLTS